MDCTQHPVVADNGDENPGFAQFGARYRRIGDDQPLFHRVPYQRLVRTNGSLHHPVGHRFHGGNRQALPIFIEINVVHQVGLIVVQQNDQVGRGKYLAQLIAHQIDNPLKIQPGYQTLLNGIDDLQLVIALLQAAVGRLQRLVHIPRRALIDAGFDVQDLDLSQQSFLLALVDIRGDSRPVFQQPFGGLQAFQRGCEHSLVCQGLRLSA